MEHVGFVCLYKSLRVKFVTVQMEDGLEPDGKAFRYLELAKSFLAVPGSQSTYKVRINVVTCSTHFNIKFF